MVATPHHLDFSNVADVRQEPSGVVGVKGTPSKPYLGNPNAPRTAEGKLLTQKQIRARMRRKAKRGELITDEEQRMLYKPIEEWDLDELAHGRPRGPGGTLRGPAPKWITREMHERATSLFKAAVRSQMNGHTPGAIETINKILTSEEVDEKGKPIVPASTKLDAAKFLLEHVVGKPTQRVESDISVKLQGILAQVMVNPDQANGSYNVGHLPGVTMPMANDVIDGDADYDDGDMDLNENFG
jgi:hypothetical protein